MNTEKKGGENVKRIGIFALLLITLTFAGGAIACDPPQQNDGGDATATQEQVSTNINDQNVDIDQNSANVNDNDNVNHQDQTSTNVNNNNNHISNTNTNMNPVTVVTTVSNPITNKVVSIYSASNSQQQSNNQQQGQIQKGDSSVKCPVGYTPVIGSDGKTYFMPVSATQTDGTGVGTQNTGSSLLNLILGSSLLGGGMFLTKFGM